MTHPVATLLTEAAAGHFPPADGGWHRVPPWRTGVEAALAFTCHAVLAVAADVPGAGHDRVHFAHEIRDDVRTYGRTSGLDVATVARGIGGLDEISVELDANHRGQGLGAAFVRVAAAVVPADRVVVAAVAPGNAASLRAFLAAGFGVLGSVQLLRPVRR